MADRDRYKRMTDLWRPGEVLVYQEGTPADDGVEPPVPGVPDTLVWVQKLNRFESEECRSDADTAKTRTEMILRDLDSDAYKTITMGAQQLTDQQIIDALVASRYSKHMAEAANSVQADPSWHDKLDVIQRTDLRGATTEEEAIVAKLSREYFDEVNKRVEDRDAEERRSVTQLDGEVLRKEYIDAFVDSRGSAIWQRELRIGEVMFGIRMCDAELCETVVDHAGNERCQDGWHHNACSHERLYLEAREVRDLPDMLFDRYVAAFNRVNVAAGQAKGSGSRAHSSEPSPAPSEPVDSTVSTQDETSPEAAGTSE